MYQAVPLANLVSMYKMTLPAGRPGLFLNEQMILSGVDSKIAAQIVWGVSAKNKMIATMR